MNELIYSNSKEFIPIEAKWNNITKHILYNGKPTDQEFISNYHKISSISENLALNLLDSINSTPRLEFSVLDCRKDFVATALAPQEEKSIRDNFPFHNFKKSQLKIVKEIINEVKDTIFNCLGCNFRILNVRGFVVRPGTQILGPNRSHTDARFPRDTYKLLLYLTEASDKSGHTVVRIGNRRFAVIGSPGTFLFFNPVQHAHYGVCPEEGQKELVEITLCPWEETILKPVFGGTNSRHPIE